MSTPDVIHACYSIDNPREAFIDYQIRLCGPSSRKRSEKLHWIK